MSVQIFLQGKILDVQSFLLAPPAQDGAEVSPETSELLLAGRSYWVSLLSEVVPRALLEELGLARILLGSGGGGEFLLVLPVEFRSQAEEFLIAAAADAARLSGGRLRLVWCATENLGDWSIVRKRLHEEMQRKRGTPAAGRDDSLFAPYASANLPADDYFIELALGLHEAKTVSWSAEEPARIRLGEGPRNWSLTSEHSLEGITLARHASPSDDGHRRAGAVTLAARAEGRLIWGVLRGDVDSFGIRLRRAQSIEEHVQLSVMYKQFFAGELEVLCSMPEFWRKVTIVYSGGDDFAVYGAWEALVGLARELRRLFHRFTEEGLKDFPGLDGKTLSMALALAPAPGAPLASVYQEAGAMLEAAKSADKDCFALLGRTLDWRQVATAAELKDTMTKMVRELGCSPQFLMDLAGLTSREPAAGGKQDRYDKPWRFHRRLNRTLDTSRDRELQKMRTHLITEMLGKSAAHAKLRPAGRVAVAWSTYLTEVDANA